MLYIFDKIDSIDNDLPDNLMSLLSDERSAKVRKLRSINKKKASAIAYLLLRTALFDMYSINEAVEFDYTVKGKPVLNKYPHIHFNLSHSKNSVACVISTVEVGVDIQQISPVMDKVAKRVLTMKEYAIFKKIKNPDDYFCEVWTIKESYLKKTGQGLTTELNSISADKIKDIQMIKGENYYCCVCGQKMQVKYVGREDIEQLCN